MPVDSGASVPREWKVVFPNQAIKDDVSFSDKLRLTDRDV